MRRFFPVLIIALAITSEGIAQEERYLDDIFEYVTVTSDVIYGKNAAIINVPSTGEAVPQALTLDIYEPTGDTETERPLVLVFHTGNFLPNIINGQITGTKNDNSAVEICTQLAKKGYVAASVTYRKGWNPFANSQDYRAFGLIQAMYKGIQDGRTAIRFFRHDQEYPNKYGIDPNRITAWGNGTGGYISLGLATLDDYLEIPTSMNNEGKFLFDLIDASTGLPGIDGIPETPMIVPAYHGDIEGKVLTIAPDDAFGLPAGDTTNYPNYVEHSSKVNMAVNLSGAIGDISWIDENTSPIVTVQSANDIFFPYDNDLLITPTSAEVILRVQGGIAIHNALTEAGVNEIFDNTNFNTAAWPNDVSIEAEANSATTGHDYFKSLYPLQNPVNSIGLDEGTAIEWWDPNALSPPVAGAPNGVPWNMLPHPLGGTFHAQGLVTNENMSAENAIANITKYMNFVTPRMCVVLGLPCKSLFVASGIEETILDSSILEISPNPASTTVNISAEGKKINTIAIYSMDGKLHNQITNVNAESATIQTNNLPTGIYFVKAYFDEGIVTQKVTFK